MKQFLMASRPVGIALFIALLALTVLASQATADHGYEFPRTNDENRDSGLPHVNFLSASIGEVTLDFVNPTNSLAFFEYRIDGVLLTPDGTHPVVHGDDIYPGVCIDSRASGPAAGCVADSAIRTFAASETVEIRLALGGERDWDFDWVTFAALPDAQSKDQCVDGGWEEFGFSNQGLCIQFVNTGKDSR